MTSESKITDSNKHVKSKDTDANRWPACADNFLRQASVPNIHNNTAGIPSNNIEKENQKRHASLDVLAKCNYPKAQSYQTDDIPRSFACGVNSTLPANEKHLRNRNLLLAKSLDNQAFCASEAPCMDNEIVDPFSICDDVQNDSSGKETTAADDTHILFIGDHLNDTPDSGNAQCDPINSTAASQASEFAQKPFSQNARNASYPSMQDDSSLSLDTRAVLSDGVRTANHSAISIQPEEAEKRQHLPDTSFLKTHTALPSRGSVPSLTGSTQPPSNSTRGRGSAPSLHHHEPKHIQDSFAPDSACQSTESDISKRDMSRQSSRKHPKVTFTVTRVEDDVSLSSGVSNERVLLDGFSGDADSQLQRPDSLCVPDAPGGASSDNESSYGDTLTQTSITKLLSNKFKSYRTYRYNISQSRDREQGPGFRKRLYSKYESQDYDQIENTLFLREQEKEKSLRVRRKWLARWIVSFLIGIGTAIVASIIEVCIEYIAHYKFLALRKLVWGCEGGACVALPLLVWVLINSACVCLGSLLVTYGEPQAAGSGIPQIKCYLNGVKIPGLLTLRALVAKALGVILSVTGGLACGKEGPMIHSGAIVAAGVSQGRSRLFNKDFGVFEYLRSDTERRDFVSGGAAAGVAAAFGAPVGGVLFSLEEGASFWNQSLTWRIVFASMVATFSVNVILSAIHGHPADLSNPGLISFGKFSDIKYQAIEIPVFLLMAVFGGLSGALYNYINCKLTVFRKKYVLARWAKVVEAVVVAVVSATMAFLLIYTFNDCVPTKRSHGHEQSYVQLNCPEGQHNIMAHLFFKTPEAALISVLHDEAGAYTVQSLALFTLLYWCLACWTYGLSVSSGVFIPSLLTGAAWGRLTGMAVFYLFPKMGYDYGELTVALQSTNLGKYALIGAACQLGGTVRMTISLTVILIECTGDITFGLPIVMVLTIAKWTGDFFNTGLYDLHIQMMGIPLLPWEPPEMSYDITANQVMNRPVVVLRSVERVTAVVDVLENTPHLHSGFPVVDTLTPTASPAATANTTDTHKHAQEGAAGSQLHDINESTETDLSNSGVANGRLHSENSDAAETMYGKCRGLILRSQLLLILKHKVFVPHSDVTCSHTSLPDLLPLEHFRDAHMHPRSLKLELTENERNSYVDLRPYLNPSPYTVNKNTSLPRMFKLFRGLGLRHLIVVNEDNQVLGMVTRKDLAKYRLYKTLMEIKVQELHIHHD